MSEEKLFDNEDEQIEAFRQGSVFAAERALQRCAEAAHEMNRIYCEATGDTSQPRWAEAPEWQKTSAINGVRGVLSGNTPEQSHESWLKEKIETGWKYGPVKDPSAKEHPCMVPYAELPPGQKAKDVLYVATVKAMALALGVGGSLFRLHEDMAFVDNKDKHDMVFVDGRDNTMCAPELRNYFDAEVRTVEGTVFTFIRFNEQHARQLEAFLKEWLVSPPKGGSDFLTAEELAALAQAHPEDSGGGR